MRSESPPQIGEKMNWRVEKRVLRTPPKRTATRAGRGSPPASQRAASTMAVTRLPAAPSVRR